MGKFSGNKELSKIAKGTLAVVLAGTVVFSASNAFAEGTAEKTQTVTATTDTSQTTTTTATVESKEAPSLLPGDFFYFAKLALEKIKLALAFDKVKDAQLMAGYAAERLAEAEALFHEGKQDDALNAIRAAMDNMNQADQLINENKESSSSNVKTEIKAANNEEVQVASEQTKAGDQSVPKNNDDEQVNEVQEILSKNIRALTAAMEKVKNPVARAALQKNIDKSYAKLVRKIKKYEEKFAKKTQKDEQKAEKETVTAVKNPTEFSSEEKVTTEVKSAPVTAEVHAAVSQSGEMKAPVSTRENVQTKEQVHAEIKPVPSVVKQENQQIKQQIKQEIKHETNQIAKQEIKQIPKKVNERIEQRQAEGKLFVKGQKENSLE